MSTHEQSAASDSLDAFPGSLPTGPYAGLPIEEVALIDPDYLIDLVREGVGDVTLRAEAARALATRDRLPPARIARTFARAALHRIGPPRPPPRPWLAVLGLGATFIIMFAFLARAPSIRGLAGSSLIRARSALSGQSGSAGPTGTSEHRGDLRIESVLPNEGSSTPSTVSTAPVGSSDAITSASGPSPPDGSTLPNGSLLPCGARIPGAIPSESVEDFIDTHQAVEFQVFGTKDTGRVTFLNSHDPYQDHFYVAIFPDDYSSFPEPPAIFFRGKCVVVRGTIERYRGTPQIVLRDPDDVRLVPENAPRTDGR